MNSRIEIGYRLIRGFKRRCARRTLDQTSNYKKGKYNLIPICLSTWYISLISLYMEKI